MVLPLWLNGETFVLHGKPLYIWLEGIGTKHTCNTSDYTQSIAIDLVSLSESVVTTGMLMITNYINFTVLFFILARIFSII